MTFLPHSRALHSTCSGLHSLMRCGSRVLGFTAVSSTQCVSASLQAWGMAYRWAIAAGSMLCCWFHPYMVCSTQPA